MLRRVLAGGVAVVAITAGIAALAPAPAFAVTYWHSTASGTARALAQSIPQPAAPVAVVNGPQVTVTWSATTMSGGSPVPGYVVRRYNQSGVSQTVNANCSGTLTTTSCVENLVPPGQWRYSVRGVAGTFWIGPESAQSATVTVGTAGFVVTSSMPITSLPATVGGTISGFASAESLTYHLDSATGPTLSGSPANATALGGGTVSVTIPATTSDAPHSIFVVGGLGSTAAAAVNIVIPPKLVSLQMRDANANGKVDQVLATFDEALGSYSAGVAPWTLTNVPSGGTLQSVSVNGMVATLTLAEGTGAASTAAGTFKIALAANSAGIRDPYDHPSSFAATAVADAAPPAATSLLMQDTNANGKVDRVVATFSETLATYSAGNAPWTLANVPSGGTLASLSSSSATVTLTLTEGSGAVDTAVGSMTVSLAANASGVRDSFANLTSFTGVAPADGAKPFAVGIADTNGATDGKIEPGDTLSFTFSEALNPTSVPTSATVTLTDPNSGGSDTLTITGITSGARSTGSNLYVTPNNTSAAFANSTVSLSADKKTVTVTVGGTCVGSGCGASLGQATSNGTFSYVAATTLTDAAGNTPLTTALTPSMRLF